MATQQTTIYNSDLIPNQENLSTELDHGLGFYLLSSTSEQTRVEVFLQLQITNTSYRQIRLDHNNISSTQRLTLIPQPIVELGLPMRLAIVPSAAFRLQIILLQSDCGLCQLNTKIDAILENLQTIGSEDFADNLLQFAIDNLLPILIQNLLPGVNGLITSALTNLILPAIQNLLPSGGAPALPAAANNIALTGSNVAFRFTSPTTNNNSNIRFS
ncbi:MAG: hypothetical protein AAF652_08585 [Cyanobacteria bacterium P01_C01_bin.72]